MKTPPILLLLLAASLPANASHSTPEYKYIPIRRFANNPDTEALVVVDPASGSFTMGYRSTGHPDFLWWPAAKPLPFGAFSPTFTGGVSVAAGDANDRHKWRTFAGGGLSMAAGDVNGDGSDDLLFTSETTHEIVVYPGAATPEASFSTYERHPISPGPAGVAIAELNSNSPGLELAVPLLAGLAPRAVEVRPQSGWTVNAAPMATINPALAPGFQDFALLPAGSTAAGNDRRDPFLAFCFKVSAGSQLHVARPYATGPAAISPHAEPFTHVLAAEMRGPNEPGQFVLWGEGLDSFTIVTVTTQGATFKEFSVTKKTDSAVNIHGAGGDSLAVVHDDGAQVTIFRWNAASGDFVTTQNLTAPAGRRFTNAAGMKSGGLFAVLDDGTYALHGFNAGGQLVPLSQGVLPAMPAFGGHATVMLYTDDPLSGSAFEFESFLAGHWTGGATLAGGQISAVSEIFQSTALGLGDPLNVLLTPSANPGAAAQAQGNQFGDASSSIFFAGGAGADGNAAVQISPQSGSYGAVIQVKFTPAVAGTSVVYRVNGQAWQQAGAGGFFLAADAQVDYYGQTAGGALSTIHSANYDITPQFAADANGDGLPDALAASLGLDPGGDGDTDDDGVGDANELLNGGDPRNANSQPAALNVTLPPSLEVSLSVQTPSETGPGDTASRWMRVSMMTTGGSMVRENLVMVNGGGSFPVDAALLPAARAGEPGLSDFERALIAEVELQGTDPEARGASLFGMAFAPGFVLPQQPADEAPSLTRWIADTTAAVGGASGGIWKTTNFLTTDTGPMLINADTTLAVAAFSAWTAHRLGEAGVADANFAWDHRGSRAGLPAHELDHVHQQLRSMERPVDPATPAWDLGAVARRFYSAIATGATYEPLRIAAREMIRRDGDPDRPIILGRIHNAAQALLHFFDTGELEPFYATSITQPMAVLNTLRAQLLGLPQPRSTRTGVGILRSMDGGRTWVVETAGGEIIALLDDRRIAVMTATGLTLQRQPATARTFPMWHAALARNDSLTEVRVFGFTLADTEPRPAGTDSAMVVHSVEALDFNFRGDLNDTDGDRLDDAFEMQFFNGLDASFDDDTDDDGFFNGEEYFLLTDPASAASRPPGVTTAPRNIAVSPAPGGGLCVCWDGRPDTSYQVAESPDLAAWSGSAALPVQTAPGRYQWTNPGTAARLFVQIVTQFE